MKMDYSMDEAQLLQKIKDSNVRPFFHIFNILIIFSQVIITKDYTRWHWDAISELLSGALLNPSHLAKALNTKFVKRILSFLRPSNKLFSVMPWSPVSLTLITLNPFL